VDEREHVAPPAAADRGAAGPGDNLGVAAAERDPVRAAAGVDGEVAAGEGAGQGLVAAAGAQALRL